MFLETVEIKNFRKIDYFGHNFDQNITLITGESGSGKTAIIDSIAIALSAIFSEFTEIKTKRFESFDRKIHIKNINQSGFYIEKHDIPPTISCQCNLNNKQLSWQFPWLNPDLHNYSKQLQKSIQNFEEVSIPIILHYGADRNWILTAKKNLLQPLEPESRTQGYQNYFKPHKSRLHFLRWLYTQELIAKTDKRRKTYEAFVSLVSRLPTGEFYYDLKTKSIICCSNDNLKLLELGGKVDLYLFALIADIAYRATLLNPHLLDRVFQESCGIVLIDDLDLNLDKKNLLFLLNNLSNIFPNLHFILTLGSQALPDMKLFNQSNLNIINIKQRKNHESD